MKLMWKILSDEGNKGTDLLLHWKCNSRSVPLLILLSFLLMFTFFIGGCSSNGEHFAPCSQSAELQNSSIVKGLTIHFIDVGQGDSILIQTPSGQNMLIDGGEREQGEKIIKYLDKHNVDEISVIVATHPHSDHIGGLIDVLKKIPVGKIYMPKVNHTTPTFKGFLNTIKDKGLKVSTARAGINIPLQGVEASFIGPVDCRYENLNNYSAVVLLKYGSTAFLFTGDAEKESEEEILGSGVNIKADLLKVGHHGSSSSTSKEFFEKVSPQYAVIMCGKHNDYGHPHKETIDLLLQNGVKIYRTDELGTIVFSSNGKTIIPQIIDNSSTISADVDLNKQENDNDIIFIGNKKSKKFHRSDCKCLPAEHNRVNFKTREEAIEMGFTPCGLCEP